MIVFLLPLRYTTLRTWRSGCLRFVFHPASRYSIDSPKSRHLLADPSLFSSSVPCVKLPGNRKSTHSLRNEQQANQDARNNGMLSGKGRLASRSLLAWGFVSPEACIVVPLGKQCQARSVWIDSPPQSSVFKARIAGQKKSHRGVASLPQQQNKKYILKHLYNICAGISQ